MATTSSRDKVAAMMRAVLFDLDDTLVDQASAAGAAAVAWAAEHGITGADVGSRWARVSDRHYQAYQRRELTFQEQRRERVREFLAIDADDDVADEIFAGYLARYEAGWATFDDALPALRRARTAGLTIALLTNGDEDHQRLKLERLGLAGEIDLLIASSTLPAGKPDPRAFLLALERIGVGAYEALMVGDSLERDVRGALAVGLDATLLDRHDLHPGTDVRRVRTLHDLEFDSRPT